MPCVKCVYVQLWCQALSSLFQVDGDWAVIVSPLGWLFTRWFTVKIWWEETITSYTRQHCTQKVTIITIIIIPETRKNFRPDRSCLGLRAQFSIPQFERSSESETTWSTTCIYVYIYQRGFRIHLLWSVGGSCPAPDYFTTKFGVLRRSLIYCWVKWGAMVPPKCARQQTTSLQKYGCDLFFSIVWTIHSTSIHPKTLNDPLKSTSHRRILVEDMR